MGLINLSASYREQCSGWRYLQSLRHPDHYLASTIEDLEELTTSSDKRLRTRGATVRLTHCSAKRFWPDDFDDEDGVSIDYGLRLGGTPMFVVCDGARKILTGWYGNEPDEYRSMLRTSGMRQDRFTNYYGAYLRCTAGGSIYVFGFARTREVVSVQRLTLLEKLMPQPACVGL